MLQPPLLKQVKSSPAQALSGTIILAANRTRSSARAMSENLSIQSSDVEAQDPARWMATPPRPLRGRAALLRNPSNDPGEEERFLRQANPRWAGQTGRRGGAFAVRRKLLLKTSDEALSGLHANLRLV